MIPNRVIPFSSLRSPDFSQQSQEFLAENDLVECRRKGITLLKKYGQEIARLQGSSKQADWLIADIADPTIQKITEIAKRTDYAITSFDAQGIPQMEAVEKQDTQPFLRCKCPHIRPRRISKAEADLFVQSLSSSDVALEGEDGCYATADLICRILEVAKVQQVKKTLVKGRLQPLIPASKKKELAYLYHIAATLIAQDGNEYVLDPLLDPMQALSKEEWKARLTHDPKQNIHLERSISSSETYDAARDSIVSVTKEIFERHKQTISYHAFSQLVPHKSYLERYLLGDTNLEGPLPFSDSDPDPGCCTLS